eukprot:10937614-Ditylum_brightwellii.AAC.1
MTPYLYRSLLKATDLRMKTPAGETCWPAHCHKLLTFWEWKGSFGEFGKIGCDPKGIFCGNFGVGRGHYTPCQKTRCAKCYRMRKDLQFPRVLPTNNEGVIFKQRLDPDKCLAA